METKGTISGSIPVPLLELGVNRNVRVGPQAWDVVIPQDDRSVKIGAPPL